MCVCVLSVDRKESVLGELGYVFRANNHAVPVREIYVVAVSQAIADGTIPNPLLALF